MPSVGRLEASRVFGFRRHNSAVESCFLEAKDKSQTLRILNRFECGTDRIGVDLDLSRLGVCYRDLQTDIR
jgi:hypothetical protein